MLDFPRWKVLGISLICLIGIIFAVPSLFPERQVQQWAPWLPSARINLGLDLAGGSYLLLEADSKDVAKQQIAERISRADRSRLPGPRRPRGRHALAQRLHRMADSLDG